MCSINTSVVLLIHKRNQYKIYTYFDCLCTLRENFILMFCLHKPLMTPNFSYIKDPCTLSCQSVTKYANVQPLEVSGTKYTVTLARSAKYAINIAENKKETI